MKRAPISWAVGGLVGPCGAQNALNFLTVDKFRQLLQNDAKRVRVPYSKGGTSNTGSLMGKSMATGL